MDKDATLPDNWPVPEGPKEIAFSDAMIAYWTSFARTGVPKAPGQPDWPAYAPNKSYMHFAETPEPSTDLIPGMFNLNEEVMQRERRAGDQAWGGNVGVAAPVLSSPAPAHSSPWTRSVRRKSQLRVLSFLSTFLLRHPAGS